MSITIYDGRTNAVPVASNVQVVLLPTVAAADLKTVTLAEYNAGTAIETAIKEVNLTGSPSTQTVQYLSDKDVEQVAGSTTFSVDPIVIDSGDPQTPNTFLDGLAEGQVKYLVQRYGLAHDAAAAASQKVKVTEVEIALIEDMPVAANADGTKFQTRIHFMVRRHERNAVIAA